MIYRTLIVDDEPLARLRLRTLLSSIDAIEVTGEAENGFDALEQCRKLQPDLIFLDVQMPGMNGFELLQHLDFVPLVIFTTAYDEYVFKAFDSMAVGYLLKPIKESQLRNAVRKLQELGNRFQPETALVHPGKSSRLDPALYLRRFATKAGNRWKVFSEAEITCFLAKEKSTYLKSAGQEWLVPFTLQTLEKRVDPQVFLRCHRSCIVALSQVKEARSLGSGRLSLRLSDGSELESSRAHSQEIKKRLLHAKAAIL